MFPDLAIIFKGIPKMITFWVQMNSVSKLLVAFLPFNSIAPPFSQYSSVGLLFSTFLLLLKLTLWKMYGGFLSPYYLTMNIFISLLNLLRIFDSSQNSFYITAIPKILKAEFPSTVFYLREYGDKISVQKTIFVKPSFL